MVVGDVRADPRTADLAANFAALGIGGIIVMPVVKPVEPDTLGGLLDSLRGREGRAEGVSERLRGEGPTRPG